MSLDATSRCPNCRNALEYDYDIEWGDRFYYSKCVICGYKKYEDNEYLPNFYEDDDGEVNILDRIARQYWKAYEDEVSMMDFGNRTWESLTELERIGWREVAETVTSTLLSYHY